MSVFKEEQAHPLVLLRTYVRMFGLEALSWEPEVIKQSIEDETSTSAARVNLNKLMAAICVANRDSFWTEWESFHFLVECLNNNMPSLSTLQNQTVGQLMVAVDIANTIRQDLKELSPAPSYSESVARYIAAQALEDGITYLPPPLGFANKYVNGKIQKCKVCGLEEDVQEDRLCSFCTDRYDHTRLGSFLPDPTLVEQGHGKETEVVFKYPSQRIKARLDEVLTKPNTNLKDTQVDVCVGKLVDSVYYMLKRRSQLERQSA